MNYCTLQFPDRVLCLVSSVALVLGNGPRTTDDGLDVFLISEWESFSFITQLMFLTYMIEIYGLLVLFVSDMKLIKSRQFLTLDFMWSRRIRGLAYLMSVIVKQQKHLCTVLLHCINRYGQLWVRNPVVIFSNNVERK